MRPMAAGLLASAVLGTVPATNAASLRALGRISIRGRDAGPIVIELAPPRIRVEVDLAQGGVVAGFDGEEAWGFDARPGRAHAAPIPPDLARELVAILGAGGPRRWKTRLPAGRRTREVEIAFDGALDGSGTPFPACIGIGDAGAAPAIVIDVTRVEADPEIGPEWFSPPPIPLP